MEVILKSGEVIKVYKNGLKLLANDKNYEDKDKDYQRIKVGGVYHFIQSRKEWMLTQLPEVESALVSMDPNTG